MTRVILALLVLLLSVPCAAQDRATAVALGAYASLSAVDLAQTQWALGTGRFTEANPSMKWATKPETMAVLKVGSAAAITTMAWKIRKRKPKTALALAVGAAVIQGAVVAHNAKVIR